MPDCEAFPLVLTATYCRLQECYPVTPNVSIHSLQKVYLLPLHELDGVVLTEVLLLDLLVLLEVELRLLTTGRALEPIHCHPGTAKP